MAEINFVVTDKTLARIDEALEFQKKTEAPRSYLGMSEIGTECRRALFYSFRGARRKSFDAAGVKRVEDGFAQEDVMAKRLRMLPFIELHTLDPENPKEQIGFRLLLEHFCGHCDGIIRGVLEAPATWHIWEHKSVDVGTPSKKGTFANLIKMREEHGEKNALANWNPMYYGQAQIYMHESRLDRHYLTVSTPGGRDFISIRTEYNRAYAEMLIGVAKEIIFDNWTIPARISDSITFLTCSWCPYKEICHNGAVPDVHCRSCRYREPIEKGQNKCLAEDRVIDKPMLNTGCPKHIFNPALLNVELIEHQDDGCLYKNNQGFIFSNTNLTGMPDVKGRIDAIFTSKELLTKVKDMKTLNAGAMKIIKTFEGEMDLDITKDWNNQPADIMKDLPQ